ncbi:hypothetical protein D3C84_1251190 [compost metagenome]
MLEQQQQDDLDITASSIEHAIGNGRPAILKHGFQQPMILLCRIKHAYEYAEQCNDWQQHARCNRARAHPP